MADATQATTTPLFDNAAAKKILIFMTFLALGTTALAAFAHFYGQYINQAGHSASTTAREIVIANDVLMIEDNHIRFAEQRGNGVHSRIDLYAAWPTMEGYSLEKEAIFNSLGEEKHLIFMSLEPARMSRDMSGRLEPIYRSLMIEPIIEGPAGLVANALKNESGTDNELIYVGRDLGERPFVARCLAGDFSKTSLAPCERDVQFESGLSLSYRFPMRLLADWRRLDAVMMDFVEKRRLGSY